MTDNPMVNIYIETSSRGPKVKGGRYMCLIEYTLSTGEPATWGKISGWMEGTESRLALLALEKALSRLRVSCVINLYTPCRHVISAIECGWPDGWKNNGWKTAGGKPVRNGEEWMRLDRLMDPHLIFTSAEDNSFRRWMRNQLEKTK